MYFFGSNIEDLAAVLMLALKKILKSRIIALSFNHTIQLSRHKRCGVCVEEPGAVSGPDDKMDYLFMNISG